MLEQGGTKMRGCSARLKGMKPQGFLPQNRNIQVPRRENFILGRALLPLAHPHSLLISHTSQAQDLISAKKVSQKKGFIHKHPSAKFKITSQFKLHTQVAQLKLILYQSKIQSLYMAPRKVKVRCTEKDSQKSVAKRTTE